MKKRKHIASKKNGSRKISKTTRRDKRTGQKHKHTARFFKTERKIIYGAYKMADEKFLQATATDVAKASGISRQTLKAHYENLNDISHYEDVYLTGMRKAMEDFSPSPGWSVEQSNRAVLETALLFLYEQNKEDGFLARTIDNTRIDNLLENLAKIFAARLRYVYPPEADNTPFSPRSPAFLPMVGRMRIVLFSWVKREHLRKDLLETYTARLLTIFHTAAKRPEKDF